ncbi:MAG TPA: bifunctional alpha/beta hydrolase/OsmC family protein [Xanthobacteraceae bacterium]|jgi:putative redox protein|nr:bifunctional alpha/beta hydrolase/OsmC family protein [Xanthobacteraceae bacterium]
MSPSSVIRATFPGSSGAELAARLELPGGAVRAFALFAHCFTCTKDALAARRIASSLAAAGVAVLRFDFTGLGSSEGDFANTNFSSNVDDLIRAADYLRRSYEAPAILIGHSLGGAAVLAAAGRISEAKAVVTIGAPADVGHVLRQLGGSLDEIMSAGEAEVTLAGRRFRIRRSFVEDAGMQRLEDKIRTLGRALLILHAPRDDVVGIDNASRIFLAAKHPKSFISLDDADHLLSRPQDAAYAAGVIAAWAARYLPQIPVNSAQAEHVVVRETGEGKFQNLVAVGRHRLIADEPVAVGGLDTGPNPYDYLSIALGACTAMTLRVYAEHKALALPRISVEVRHGKVAADHCADCGKVAEGRNGKIDRFERIVRIEGEINAELADKVVEIAEKCPVHRTLESSSAIVTRLAAE